MWPRFTSSSAFSLTLNGDFHAFPRIQPYPVSIKAESYQPWQALWPHWLSEKNGHMKGDEIKQSYVECIRPFCSSRSLVKVQGRGNHKLKHPNGQRCRILHWKKTISFTLQSLKYSFCFINTSTFFKHILTHHCSFYHLSNSNLHPMFTRFILRTLLAKCCKFLLYGVGSLGQLDSQTVLHYRSQISTIFAWANACSTLLTVIVWMTISH